MGRARQEVGIAARLLDSTVELVDPADLAQLAGQAAAVCHEAKRLLRARTTIDRLLALVQQVKRVGARVTPLKKGLS
jgi:hypothetical protein